MQQKPVFKIIAFSVIFGAFFTTAEIIGFRLIKKQENIIRESIKHLGEKDLLFMGDSHIAFSISASSNVAARSEPYLFTFKKLQLLKPKVAVIGLNVQSMQYGYNTVFEDGLLSVPQYRYLMHFLTQQEKDDVFALMEFETEAFYISKEFIPYLGSRFNEDNTYLLFGGWENWGSTSHLSEFQIKKHYYKEFEDFKFQLSYFQMKYLQKILVYAQQHQIQIIFVSTPLYSRFSNLIPEKVYLSFHEMLSSFRESYSFAYYDYTYLPLSPACFFDADHLNGLGATEFTAIMMDKLQKERVFKTQ